MSAGLDAALLPTGLLQPFHEIRVMEWDGEKGRIEAVRHNRFDDWFYACHFLSDPVMPGCWGVDAVWQALRYFAAAQGLKGVTKPMGMDGVSFFGQIRPFDKEIVYSVDVLSIERDGAEAMVTGKAKVCVDGMEVYSIASAQVGTAFWESDGARGPALPPAPARPFARKLTRAEFGALDSLTHAEVIALSRGALVAEDGAEMGLLPDSLMLELHEVNRLFLDPALGEGEVLASRGNRPDEWFYPMNEGVKPTALLIDAVWQALGLTLAWAGNPGTGRALGFEKVEVFDDVRPEDGGLAYRLRILKTFKAPLTGDAFVRADAEVFADGRKVLAMANANVGCHKGIRYSDYPMRTEMATGGKLKVRA